MGMYDYVVVLDEVLRCPHGHQVDGFQTKSFDNPSMNYLPRERSARAPDDSRHLAGIRRVGK